MGVFELHVGGPHWKNISFRFGVDTDGRVLQEKLSGGVLSDFLNLNPFCDQDVRFSLPYLTLDLEINTLFQTCLMISSLAFRIDVKSVLEGILSKTSVCKSYPILDRNSQNRYLISD